MLGEAKFFVLAIGKEAPAPATGTVTLVTRFFVPTNVGMAMLGQLAQGIKEVEERQNAGQRKRSKILKAGH